jgi:hypothetical protein
MDVTFLFVLEIVVVCMVLGGGAVGALMVALSGVNESRWTQAIVGFGLMALCMATAIWYLVNR